MTGDTDMSYDAATALGTLLSELIVELVKAKALPEYRVAKILLRAEGLIDALQFQKDQDETPAQLRRRVYLHRAAVGQVSEDIEERLALRPRVYALRLRRQRLAAVCRRRRKG